MSESDNVADMFERVGNLFPGEYDAVSVSSDTSVVQALGLMLEGKYSQVPVNEGSEVLGIFSLWSLAEYCESNAGQSAQELAALTVGDLIQRVPWVTVEDDLHHVLKQLEVHEALLVGIPHRSLQAVATAWDFLVHFYDVARPYVLLREIELCLREIIRACADSKQLEECIAVSVARKYEQTSRRCPEELEDMEFDDYRSLVTAKANWRLFTRGFGKNKRFVDSKLRNLARIRNDVFHFRSGVSVGDYRTLANERDWLLTRYHQLRPSAQERTEAQP